MRPKKPQQHVNQPIPDDHKHNELVSMRVSDSSSMSSPSCPNGSKNKQSRHINDIKTANPANPANPANRTKSLQFSHNHNKSDAKTTKLHTDSIHHAPNATLYIIQPTNSSTLADQSTPELSNGGAISDVLNDSAEVSKKNGLGVGLESSSDKVHTTLSINQDSNQSNEYESEQELKRRQFEMLLFETQLSKLDSIINNNQQNNQSSENNGPIGKTKTPTLQPIKLNTETQSGKSIPEVPSTEPFKKNQNIKPSSPKVTPEITTTTQPSNTNPMMISLWKEQLKYPELLPSGTSTSNPSQRNQTTFNSSHQSNNNSNEVYNPNSPPLQPNPSPNTPTDPNLNQNSNLGVANQNNNNNNNKNQQNLKLSETKGGVYYTPNGKVDKPKREWDRVNYKNNLFSWAEIQLHNSPTDCWLIVANEVYDVTNMLKNHPGGENTILQFAGTVVDRHYNFHSKKAHKIWLDYRIGLVETPQTINSGVSDVKVDLCSIM
jgi:cytochrome b involved in lipid metabolism